MRISCKSYQYLTSRKIISPLQKKNSGIKNHRDIINHIQPEAPLVQLVSIPSGHIDSYAGEEANPHFKAQASFKGVVEEL